MNVLSLFTGAGGFDLGLEEAGFRIAGAVETDPDARRTIAENRPHWQLSEPGDIHAHEPASLLRALGIQQGELTILSGGPPCQPFSKSGYWATGDSARLHDSRAATLRAYMGVAEAALPSVLLIENVKGLSYAGKDEGIRLLRRGINGINRRQGTAYRLQMFHLNTMDFGVPQTRERVFLIACREGTMFQPPAETHGPGGQTRELLPHTTTWDAIGELDAGAPGDELKLSGKWAALLDSIPEGQNYCWHTERGGGRSLFGWRTRYWTFLLKLAKSLPSWTLQADPGPATGPFHWLNRRLSIEEMCRLQTFPVGYRVFGSYHSARRQLGNAVPSAIGELLGLEIRRQFLGHPTRKQLRLIPNHRDGCPEPQRPGRVPRRYLCLVGDHRAHPGTGRGPGARRRAKLLRRGATLRP